MGWGCRGPCKSVGREEYDVSDDDKRRVATPFKDDNIVKTVPNVSFCSKKDSNRKFEDFYFSSLVSYRILLQITPCHFVTRLLGDLGRRIL